MEHPVTELCFGLDLVEQQLRIASGEPLSPEVRAARSIGHALEVRLYAEDPARKFMPQPGHIESLQWPETAVEAVPEPDRTGPIFRVDTGYQTGDHVTPFYDPLVAKLICWAESRNLAFDHLAAQLDQVDFRLVAPKGPRTSNLAFLRSLLDDERVRSGDYDTSLLGV